MSKILRFEQTETQRLLKLLTQNSKFVEVPTQFGKQTYTGEEQVVRLPFIDWDRLEYGGVLSAIIPGTYTATAKPRPGIKWADGTDDTKEIPWTIDKYQVRLSEMTGTEFCVTSNGTRCYWACQNDGQYHHPFQNERATKYGFVNWGYHWAWGPKKTGSSAGSNGYEAQLDIGNTSVYEFATEAYMTWNLYDLTVTKTSIHIKWDIITNPNLLQNPNLDQEPTIIQDPNLLLK